LDPATTHVPQWVRADSAGGSSNVQNGGFPLPPAPHGFRFATVGTAQGLVGTLSPTTNVAGTYVLSAKALTLSPSTPTTLELRLRNSTTGGQSAPVVQTALTQAGSWTLFTGTVTSNAAYDQVVLRPTSAAFFDAVQVCRTASATSVGQHGWWTTARAVGAVVLGSVLIAGLAWGRRRFRTRGQSISGTTSGWNVPQ